MKHPPGLSEICTKGQSLVSDDGGWQKIAVAAAAAAADDDDDDHDDVIVKVDALGCACTCKED